MEAREKCFISHVPQGTEFVKIKNRLPLSLIFPSFVIIAALGGGSAD